MNRDNTPLLEIRDLSVQYSSDLETVYAVRGLSLSLKRGQTLGLVGETGAGKTTTALAVMGLIPDPPGRVSGGSILLDGEELLGKTRQELRAIRGKRISMIFQDPMTSLNPVMTVGEQIAEVILLHERVTAAEAAAKAEEMLRRVNIPVERAGEYPHQFSGGMRQRVVIAIALACNPELLIADEPTTALDVTIQAQVLLLMKQLKQQMGTAMIMITHDLGIVADVCDHVAVIYAGSIVEHADKYTLFRNPKHPYTLGLFGSIPSLQRDERRLRPIQGTMPDPTDLPDGCPYHPRCPQAQGRCAREVPPNVQTAPGHFVRCVLFEENRAEG